MPQQRFRTLTEREFNAITAKVLASAPQNLSEQDYDRWIGPAMEREISLWERRPEPVNLKAGLRRTVENFGRVVNPVNLVEGALEFAASPINTSRQVVGAMADQYTKSREALGQGRYSEAFGHGAASLIPILGPAAADAGEQMAEGDVAGGIGAGAGLAAVSSPSAIRGTANTVRAAVPANMRNRAAASLERGAADRLTSVMSPEVGPHKARFGANAAEIAPELLQRGNVSAWSREGLHARITSAFDRAKAKLDEATDARLSARSFDTQPILDALRAQRKRWIAETVDATQSSRTPTVRISKILDEQGKPIEVPGWKTEPYGSDVVPKPRTTRVEMLDNMIAEIEALGPTARYEALQKIRQGYDLEAKATYNQLTGADFLKKQEGSRGAADGTAVLREHLARFDPQTAAANAEYSLYKTADDVLTATAEIERTRPKVGRRIMARLTGTMGGGHVAGTKGAVAGFLLGPVVESAAGAGLTTKLKTAQAMTRLAKAIRKGDEGQVASLLAQLRQLGILAVQVQGGATSPSGFQSPTTAPVR